MLLGNIRDQHARRAIEDLQRQVNAMHLRGLYAVRPGSAPYATWYHCDDPTGEAHSGEVYWYAGDETGWLLMGSAIPGGGIAGAQCRYKVLVQTTDQLAYALGFTPAVGLRLLIIGNLAAHETADFTVAGQTLTLLGGWKSSLQQGMPMIFLVFANPDGGA